MRIDSLFFEIVLCAFLVFNIFACKSASDSEELPTETINLDSLIIGTWENVSLEVIVNSFDNTDSSFSILVPNGDWESKLGIKPIVTIYDNNNTYRSEYRDLSDSIVQITRGIWNTFGDTLMLIEPEATYEYKVRLRDSLGEFQAILDWDGDGKSDDSYKGIQKRLPQ